MIERRAVLTEYDLYNIGTLTCDGVSYTSTSEWEVSSSPTEGLNAAADITFDEVVDGQDLARVLAFWGPCDDGCPQDLNGNGVIDDSGIAILLGFWESCGS